MSVMSVIPYLRPPHSLARFAIYENRKRDWLKWETTDTTDTTDGEEGLRQNNPNYCLVTAVRIA